MPNKPTPTELRESTFLLGEMAAARLFALVHHRLEELRDRDGLTQADIAKRLGVSEQHVSTWLKEPRNMTVRSAGRLLAALESHLLFDLDRFEDILAGNCPPIVAPAPKLKMNAPPVQLVRDQTGYRAFAPQPIRIEA